MKSLATYLDLHTQVYDLIQPTPNKDPYALFRSYAKEADGPILEPMCGSGCYLLSLLEEGFDVHGFDASDYMLQSLEEKAKTKKLKPKVWKGFVEDLKKPEQYKLIFIANISFCLIVEMEKAKASLKNIYEHLDENGVFVFDTATPKWKLPQPRVWTGSLFHREDGKLIILNTLTLPDRENIRHSIMKYELIDQNQIIKTEIEDYKVRMYDPETLTQLLEETGFREIKIFKIFDRDASYDEKDEMLVYECRK